VFTSKSPIVGDEDHLVFATPMLRPPRSGNGWRKSRATGKMHNELRRQCRIAAGRQPEPTAAVIDSQSMKAAEEVSRAARQPWSDKLRAVKAPENRGAPLEGPPNAAIDPTASHAIGSISAGFRGSFRPEPMTWRIKTWTW
jgi:hypothetical protein